MYRIYEFTGTKFWDLSPASGYTSEADAVAVARLHHTGETMLVVIRDGDVVEVLPATIDEDSDAFCEEEDF
jgi:hypothetical protein